MSSNLKSETISEVRGFKKNTIALVYDFDGTLSPQTMHDYTVFPELGVQSKDFWETVKLERARNGAVEILTYMRLMIGLLANHSSEITKARMSRMGQNVVFFPGVLDWFDRINRHVDKATKGHVKVRHYVISSGLKEIIDGTTIRPHLTQVYGSQLHWNADGRPVFADRAITDASKPQYLFRINKGREDLAESINEHMPENERPIPFSNIIYFGDGDTDVPSMTVTRKNGGHAIAVYREGEQPELEKCKRLFQAKRVDFFAPANYEHNKRLWIYTRVLIDKVIANMRVAVTKEGFERQYFSEAMHE